MSLPSLDLLLAKTKTLVTISVFQPIERDALLNRMASLLPQEIVNTALSELLRESRIACTENRYRLTVTGEKSIIPGTGRMFRDIQRMEYLVRSTSQGGGG